MTRARVSVIVKLALVASVALCIIILAADNAKIGSPTVPQSRLDNPAYAMRFHDKASLIQKSRSSVRLLFVGDSILSQFEESELSGEFSNADVWQHYYGDRNALNLGFFGDTTANMLWRIRSGQMDSLSPSAIVLLAGTNNLALRLWSWNVTSDVQGIDEVVCELHSHLPRAHILLLSVPPFKGHESSWVMDVEYRWKARNIKRINEALAAQFSRGAVPYVTYVDLTGVFVRNGEIDTTLLSDQIHPTPKGRALMAAMIEPQLSRILGDTPKDAAIVHGREGSK